MRRVDKQLINTINKREVLNIIRDHGPIFKAEIARLTQLSIPTIMKITDDFSKKGLIKSVGKGVIGRGKPPELLEWVSNSVYMIGADIGTTNISTILMDSSANIISKKVVRTHVQDSPDKVIDRIIETIRAVIVDSNLPPKKLLGIGLGLPGILNCNTGHVVFSPNFKWNDVDLVGPIHAAFDCTIIMDHVARAMAMGEMWFGLGQNIENFICVNLGYGIAASIVVGRELYAGSSGCAGEFGHITAELNGPLCDCGNYGCLEALASANAISKKARSAIGSGTMSAILDLAGGNLDLIEAKTVFDAAKIGDKLALDIVHTSIKYLGTAIAGLIDLLDPQMIILEGNVTKAGDILIDNLTKEVDRRKMKPLGKNTYIRLSKLGDNVGAIGAASFLLKKFIEEGGELIQL